MFGLLCPLAKVLAPASKKEKRMEFNLEFIFSNRIVSLGEWTEEFPPASELQEQKQEDVRLKGVWSHFYLGNFSGLHSTLPLESGSTAPTWVTSSQSAVAFISLRLGSFGFRM